MCVGVPAQVVSAVDMTTKQVMVETQGVRRSVDASLVVDANGHGLQFGDWVLVHVGFAMSILDEEEARRTLELFLLFADDDPDLAAFSPEGLDPIEAAISGTERTGS
jgi:hydrogenase expression/formation protein HypC